MASASDARHIRADQYTIGIIHVKQLELQAVRIMLDDIHAPVPLHPRDANEYLLGRLGKHNVVVAGPPQGSQGKVAIADVSSRIRMTFPNVGFGLLVGIAGGLPGTNNDVRLGDVVGAPENGEAVIQYDLGKYTSHGFVKSSRHLDKPPKNLLALVNHIATEYAMRTEETGNFMNKHLDRFKRYKKGGKYSLSQRFARPALPDRLFKACFIHEDGTNCSDHADRHHVQRSARDDEDEILIHHATILSGDSVIKDAGQRDLLGQQYPGALCCEMEAAGLMDEFPCLVIRGICDYADSHKNDDWQCYAAAAASAYAREVLLNLAPRHLPGHLSPSGQYQIAHTSAQVEDEGRQSDMLSTEFMNVLDFQERRIRQNQLSELSTTDKTFTWLWDSSFVDWLKGRERLFWISGKPASGKSTLMNFISRSPRIRRILHKSHDRKWETVHFFFDFRAGSGLANNFEGFLRALLLQLLPHFHDLSYIICGSEFTKHYGHPNDIFREWPIPIDLLRTALFHGLEGMNRYSKKLCLLLDGLDEYQGNKVELVNFVLALRSGCAKVCVASRSEPPFSEAFECVPSLQIHRLNGVAIRAYCKSTLQTFFSNSRRYNPDLQYLAEEITQKAQGVFLWARFAVFELIEGISCGETIGSRALSERLEVLPQELDDIYSRISRNRSPGERRVACLYLLLLCKAKAPLSASMLQEAREFVPEPWLSNVSERTSSFSGQDNSINTEYLAVKKIVAVTRGTIDIYDASMRFGGTRYLCTMARLTHRTVETYLIQKGWQEVFGYPLPDELGDEIWIRICGRRMQEEGLAMSTLFGDGSDHMDDSFPVEPVTSSTGNPSDEPNKGESTEASIAGCPRLALLAYSARQILNHAFNFEDLSKRSSLFLLERVMDSTCCRKHIEMNRPAACSCPTIIGDDKRWRQKAILCYQAALHGLRLCLEEYLAHRHNSDSKASDAPSNARNSTSDALDRVDTQIDPVNSLILFVLFYVYRRTIYSDGVTGLSLLQFLLDHSPSMTGEEVYFALAQCGPDVMGCVLRNFGPGMLKFTLKAKAFEFIPVESWDSFEHEEFERVEREFGPLSACHYWRRILSGKKEMEECLNILLERGEDINCQCGPAGTGLHYALVYPWNKNLQDIQLGLIDLLLQKGANINQEGPQGNPLEFLWMTAHRYPRPNASSTPLCPEDRRVCRNSIRALIRGGGVNQRKDPNGLIPSKEQMWFFACNETDFYECLRYYDEGPLPGGAVWSGPTPLDSSAGHFPSRNDLPYDFERMVELEEDEVEFDYWEGWIKKPATL